MEQGDYGNHSGNSRASRLMGDMKRTDELIYDAKGQLYDEDSALRNSTDYLTGGATSLAKQTGVSDPDTNNMPITGLDQTLDNSAIAKNDAMLMQENGYGMGAAKMSVLKNRYSSMVHQTQSQTDTFGINGTDPNAGVYKGIVDEANSQ